MTKGALVVIRGMIGLRLVAFAIGLFGLVSAPLSLITIPDLDSTSDYAGVVLLVVLPVGLGGAYFMIKSLEHLRITDRALEVRYVIWPRRAFVWDEIVDVELVPDVVTTIPVIRRSDGRRIKLRGAASFTKGAGSASVRAYEAIASRIGSTDGTPVEGG